MKKVYKKQMVLTMSSVSETNKKQPGESKKMITKGEASEALTTKQGWEKKNREDARIVSQLPSQPDAGREGSGSNNVLMTHSYGGSGKESQLFFPLDSLSCKRISIHECD